MDSILLGYNAAILGNPFKEHSAFICSSQQVLEENLVLGPTNP